MFESLRLGIVQFMKARPSEPLPLTSRNLSDRERNPLTVPVLFLVFNRPVQTSRVFAAIRQARPPRLYVAADGARPGVPEDVAKCAEVRRIVGRIDWPCEVKTLFRTEHFGCKRAVSGAITWFFDQELEGIILEDDCLPSLTFFWFCEALLARFRDDERVWQICGTAMLKPNSYTHTEDSYIFSRYAPIWGWASWRRAWAHYDADLTDWLRMSRPPLLNSAFRTAPERKFLLELGHALRSGRLDTWDYQWEITKVYQSGLSVIPTLNMIVNIGFGPDATHTLKSQRSTPSLKTEISSPIVHPRYIIANESHDLVYRDRVFLEWKRGRLKRVLRKIAKLCLQSLRGLLLILPPRFAPLQAASGRRRLSGRLGHPPPDSMPGDELLLPRNQPAKDGLSAD